MSESSDLMERVRQHVPTDDEVRACWPWLAKAIEIGWLDRDELVELAEHLRDGRDFGVEELLFAHVGDRLRVSFRDEDSVCAPHAMLAAVTAVSVTEPP